MSRRNGRVTRLRPPSDVGEELMGAADAIADMAQRVQLNGPATTNSGREIAAIVDPPPCDATGD